MYAAGPGDGESGAWSSTDITCARSPPAAIRAEVRAASAGSRVKSTSTTKYSSLVVVPRAMSV